jgi:hypothetical protein
MMVRGKCRGKHVPAAVLLAFGAAMGYHPHRTGAARVDRQFHNR